MGQSQRDALVSSSRVAIVSGQRAAFVSSQWGGSRDKPLYEACVRLFIGKRASIITKK